MRARRTKLMRDAGPYRVLSCADGSLRIEPDWPGEEYFDEETGGGPGLFTRMALADHVERFLNGGRRRKEIPR